MSLEDKELALVVVVEGVVDEVLGDVGMGTGQVGEEGSSVPSLVVVVRQRLLRLRSSRPQRIRRDGQRGT